MKFLLDEAFDRTGDIDKAVEEAGIFGAMQIHPNEFTAEEIMAETNADNVENMTAGMARIIIKEYEEELRNSAVMSAHKYYTTLHALEVLGHNNI